MLDNILNADVLFQVYTILGFFVFGLLLKIMYKIAKKTKNKLDDKIVDTLYKWHIVNKKKIKND